MFSTGIIEKIEYYVYRLIDPRNGETFYVGKGSGNRVFHHAYNDLKKGDFDEQQTEESEKLARIRSIRNDGFKVEHIIHRHGMDQNTAFEVEAALIDAYAGLSNIMNGEDSNDRGVMHAQQVRRLYEAEEMVQKHKLIIINVNKSYQDGERELYEAVRYAWRLSADRANKCDYVLAAVKGMIKGVFVAEKWIEAKMENFPSRETAEGRYGFHGKEAPEEIQKLYRNKRLPDDFTKKGASNPVRYLDSV